ncbi:helix-turn-helix domain-containing protein [Fibrella forsythiae]|uniref:Helix-turn-helix transcriptional regulator n=1 Tax=Fibrella forsythiae TaxID=2817061 RepID=A0ABS3JKV5_9BACT|nr:LuxR C-terminal-related transcriptional regulator [Fibrella forsythiae]MBO0949532.1 helix-turn-helix transcriptional regulator [Fibrella forsythiae]
MSLAALCPRKSIALLIMAASDEVGIQWRNPQSEAHRFIDGLATAQPRFALITQDYLRDPTLFTHIRAASPQTQIVICLTSDELTPQALWALIDELEFDVICTLPELTACLQTLISGRFYKSSLLQVTAIDKAAVTFPGFAALTQAERRVLRGICEQKTGPQIAKALFISEKTVNNHRYSMAQKLQVTGGPGSLTRYVINHRDQLLSLLA